MPEPSVNRMLAPLRHALGRRLSGALVVVALFAAPNADTLDCGTVANGYKAALGKVVVALHRYERCLAASAERDDCAAEMQALDNAHDDFADAVADAKDCR